MGGSDAAKKSFKIDDLVMFFADIFLGRDLNDMPTFAPPKTNIAPSKCWFEDHAPLRHDPFSVDIRSFAGRYWMGNSSSIRAEAILIQLPTQPCMSTSFVAKSPGRWEKSPSHGVGMGAKSWRFGCWLFVVQVCLLN